MIEIIALAVLVGMMLISYYTGKKSGEIDAYDKAFDEVVSLYEEVLREEALQWTK